MSDPTTTGPQGQSTSDAAKSAASDTAGTAAEKSKEVAGAATGQAQEVASHAREQVSTVAGEAKSQAQRVMSTASSDLESQLEDRLTRAAEAARSTAGELMALAEGRPDDAGRTGDLARQASERLERLAGRADELGPRGVVEEVSDFARRRPAAFLVGAAAAGLMVGRLARAGREAQSSDTSGPTAGGSTPGLSASTTPALATGTGGFTAPGLGGQATPGATPPADGSVAGAGSTPGGYTSPTAPGSVL